ncbi:hypothetical protein BDA99DRAFT_560143 [Phascolomyces articulosus]|uniref:Uncharacterized protein n=1 Tax=Phascolomyces articulosus TaxID=60185 RepID=A0AAD5K013_9FUNG|nr:hypothetical protein BDA99DRAFT_560143 [Phascolomyces articulosus]
MVFRAAVFKIFVTHMGPLNLFTVISKTFVKIPVGAIVLALMLSSNETVVTGNGGRALSAVLFIIVYEGSFRRLPIGSHTGPYNKVYQVVPTLAAYITDLPEQRLMAGVKSGMAMYSCPRCWTVTTNFHLPFYNTKLRKKGTMEQICKTGLTLIEAGKETLSKKLSKKYSAHVVDNAFDSVPHFSIYDCLLVDTLHLLGGKLDEKRMTTAKEHSTDTIQQMQESLRLYNLYTPAIALRSKSKLYFPKNHSLWKYAKDIEMRGVVSSYSTEASENQHKQDAK